MFPQTYQLFQISSFPSTQPCPQKAASNDCGCVSENSYTNKKTGLSDITATKKHVFGR